MLLPSIEKGVNRFFKDGIIVAIRFSDWISNLVPVRKKTKEIRLCIDFWNLKKVSLKDNYPLPKMDHSLQRVVGASQMSLLDGYSGYNQILVHEKDQYKTTFLCPHFLHPIAALHPLAETFLLWFYGHRSFLSFLATKKCFERLLPLFVEGGSFD